MSGRHEMHDELFSAHEERTFPAELGGEYEVVRELGRGGMAVVYLARDRELGREVAIKVVQAQYAANTEVVARFAREARTVAALDHPNIVTLYAVRKLADGSLALIMQYVPGETLQQAVERDGAFSFARARQILADVAHALAYAHARGIVHRDVKPENVFIDTRTGRALLSDFGIARSAELDPRVTRTNVAIGTPAYMSPEQIDGAAIDGRSDLYSLGLVGWELLAGQQPWQGEGLYNVIYRQKHDDLPPLDQVRRETPAELVAAVEGALEKDPQVRWAHADDFLDVLTGRVPLPPRRRRRTGHPPVTTAEFTLSPELANQPTVEWRRGDPPLPTIPGAPDAGEPPPADDERPAAGPAAPGPYIKRRVPDPRRGRRRRIAAAVLLGAAATAGVLAIRRTPGAIPAPEPQAVAVDQPATVPVQVRPESAAGAIITIPPAAPPAALAPAAETTLAPPAATTGPSGPAAPPVLLPPPLPRPAPATVATTTGSSAAGGAGGDTPVVPLPGTPPTPGPAGRTDGAPATAATPAGPAPDAVLVSPSAAAATLAPGGSHTCEIAADSTALCWGANNRGQLGNGTTERHSTPTSIGAEQRFVSISAGLGHTCAVAVGGIPYCWGGNDRGQLGDGTRTPRLTPVRVAEVGRVRAVESSNVHSCAITTTREVYCWGANPYGELGVSGGGLARATPVRVPTDEQVTQLALGWNHSCGLTTSRTAVCWGQNSSGQLGAGEASERGGVTPVAGGLRFVGLAAGSAHSCGVATDEAVYCWGLNRNGQLGDGTTMERARPSRVGGGARFVRVTAGSVHSCALTASGEAYCWGRNLYGQLGDGTRIDRVTPVRVESREPFVALRASGSHTCGTTSSRRNVCWGYNLDGQLGDGTKINRSRPVPVGIGS